MENHCNVIKIYWLWIYKENSCQILRSKECLNNFKTLTRFVVVVVVDIFTSFFVGFLFVLFLNSMNKEFFLKFHKFFSYMLYELNVFACISIVFLHNLLLFSFTLLLLASTDFTEWLWCFYMIFEMVHVFCIVDSMDNFPFLILKWFFLLVLCASRSWKIFAYNFPIVLQWKESNEKKFA